MQTWGSRKALLLTSGLGLLSGLVGMYLFQISCANMLLGFSNWHKTGVSEGYTLLSPYFGDTDFEGKGEIWLLNTNGKKVHSWSTQHPVLISYLQPNGHVFAALTPPLDMADYPSGGSTGVIQELDWNGTVLWEYKDHQMTHDFDVLPDGRIAYIRWHLASPSFAARVQGGMKIATSTVWTNEIVVINKDKKIVWTWKPDDHMNPVKYVLSPLVPRNDWAHINSVRYTENNPLTHTPAYLLSMRDISTVVLVEEATGKILWQSPKNLFALQHDATFTEKGTILVFDNGFLRNIPRSLLISTVTEIDPLTNKVVWQYSGGKAFLEKAQFASAIMSGAQRLEGGNTLVIASMANTILEVSPAGEVLWKYTNDYRDEEGRMRLVFKARKYTSQGSEWASWVSAWPSLNLCVRG